jgi:hypothetical protein
LFFLWGCSGLEQSEQEKLRRNNAKGEFIYRSHNEFIYPVENPKHRIREKYPWEAAYIGNLRRISKEYFRCKGSSLSPIQLDKVADSTQTRADCSGRHSLPIRNGKEFVYPVLLDLINYVQEKLHKRVVVTCGHRCPLHNTYSDVSTFNQTSKHMIAAEVDFYVQGFEKNPQDVIKVLQQFYKDNPLYQGKKEFIEFQRYEKKDTNVSTPPWFNKEILIKLFQKNEGRDKDNIHPFPYICVQVRFDRDLNEKVVFSWPKANSGYMRY